MQKDIAFLCSTTKLDQEKVNSLIKEYGSDSVLKTIKDIVSTNMDKNKKRIDHPMEYLESTLSSQVKKTEQTETPVKTKNPDPKEKLSTIDPNQKDEIIQTLQSSISPILTEVHNLKKEIASIASQESPGDPESSSTIKQIQVQLQSSKNVVEKIDKYFKRKIISLTLMLFGFGFALGALYWHIQGVLAIQLLDLRFALVFGGFIAGIGATVGFLKINRGIRGK